MDKLVLVALITMLAACGPAQQTCTERLAGTSCAAANTHAECRGGEYAEPECFCDEGFGSVGNECRLKDHAACCECLGTHYWISDTTTPDSNLDDLCVPSSEQCQSALEAGASISVATGCASGTCAGDCWYLR